MLGRTDSRLRLVALGVGFAIVATFLGVRLAYWQLGRTGELSRVAESQARQPAVAEVRRGDIVDRSGAVLATTAYRDLLAAYPDLMSPQERDENARRLTDILELDSERATRLKDELASGVPYVVVEQRLTEEQSVEVRAAMEGKQLYQLALEPQPVRFYPSSGGSANTTLASQLLGFVSEDGQGRYGVEQAADDLLAGTGTATAAASDDAPLPQTGADIQLTIDASLQLRLEKELHAAWVANRAQRVTGVVMDPYTGAILAWGSVPGYDANSYADVAQREPELFTDPMISEVYEPGSVLKMFTAAAALEAGVVGLDTPIFDDRALVLNGATVRNSDERSMGEISFADAIARSRNVATGKVAMMLGDSTDEASAVLYDMWQRLGLGRPTGVELDGESGGLVADPGQTPWQPIDLVNRAFGQGVAVTPLQLAAAFSTMVNGGQLVRPHLYAENTAAATTDMPQVISPELSATLRELMVHVVKAGPHYAEETLIDGYTVGGKTGTAQIWDNRAQAWMNEVYNHTFVGFVGAERPEAVILVRIHQTEPQRERRWGTSLEMTSNELFRRVALDTISVLDLPPLPGFVPPVDPSPELTPEVPTAPGERIEQRRDRARRPAGR